MSKKVTDSRLEKLEMSSTDTSVKIVVDWSTDEDGVTASSTDDVIHVSWSDIEED